MVKQREVIKTLQQKQAKRPQAGAEGSTREEPTDLLFLSEAVEYLHRAGFPSVSETQLRRARERGLLSPGVPFGKRRRNIRAEYLAWARKYSKEASLSLEGVRPSDLLTAPEAVIRLRQQGFEHVIHAQQIYSARNAGHLPPGIAIAETGDKGQGARNTWNEYLAWAKVFERRQGAMGRPRAKRSEPFKQTVVNCPNSLLDFLKSLPNRNTWIIQEVERDRTLYGRSNRAEREHLEHYTPITVSFPLSLKHFLERADPNMGAYVVQAIRHGRERSQEKDGRVQESEGGA